MNDSTQLGGLESVDLDFELANLAQSRAMHNDGLRREAIARTQAVALLDIAASLRVLAGEASLAMLGSGAFVDDGETEPDNTPGDLFVEGDRVRLRDESGSTGTIVSLGVSEGDVYADVELDDPDREPEVRRYFVEYLERIVGDESVEVEAEGDGESDDPEDDFTPPASALDALRELEKKPAKKKGKKS